MSKRRRTTNTRKAKRPIDKDLKMVLKDVSTAQQEQVLKTITFPGTLTGLRWSIAIDNGQSASGTNNRVQWAIIHNAQGCTTSAMSNTTGSTMYSPEQNVLAFGVCNLTDAGTGTTAHVFEGATKTQRKLKAGDQVSFIALGTQTSTNGIVGCIQFFIKT